MRKTIRRLLLSAALLVAPSVFAQTMIDGNLRNVMLTVQGQHVFDLLQGPGTRSSLQNLPVQSVIVSVDTNQAMPVARTTYFIQLNGMRITEPREVPWIGERLDFAIPAQANILGSNSRLELVLQTPLGMIQTVRVNFVGFYIAQAPPPPPPPPFGSGEVVRQDLNGLRIHSMGNIDLGTTLNLGARTGKVLRRVSVVATDAQGLGRVFLSANNQVIGGRQGLFNRPTRINFELSPGIILGRVQDIRLNFEGSDIYVDEVAVELEFGNGPIGENHIQLQGNQQLHLSGVTLTDLGAPSRLNDRLVESVEIVLRSGYRNLKISLCKANSNDCGTPSILGGSGPQTVIVSGHPTATVRETGLFFSSMLDVESLTLHLR